MKILVSACLLGENCKYNGLNNQSEKVLRYVSGHTVIPVCPEIDGGLTTPRTSCEIVNGVVQNKDGLSFDKEYKEGALACFNVAIINKIDLAILQSRSPSCGVNEIYDGSFSNIKIPGHGIFADMLIKAGIKVIDVEDL